jgi:polyisoprenoid-binding protein YceI
MADQTWNIDLAHSGIHFSVRHMVIAKVRGTFNKWSGSIVLDEANPKAARVEVKIDATSLDTAEDKRDTHLRSPDFFDTSKFGEILFKSKAVDAQGSHYKVTGDLTMHGVTREVTLEAEREGAGKDPWGNDRLAFSARASLNRTDFGLKWNQALETGGLLVGEKVDFEIEVSAVRAK